MKIFKRVSDIFHVAKCAHFSSKLFRNVVSKNLVFLEIVGKKSMTCMKKNSTKLAGRNFYFSRLVIQKVCFRFPLKGKHLKKFICKFLEEKIGQSHAVCQVILALFSAAHDERRESGSHLKTVASLFKMFALFFLSWRRLFSQPRSPFCQTRWRVISALPAPAAATQSLLKSLSSL